MSQWLYINTERTRHALGHLRTMADRGDDLAARTASAAFLAALDDSGSVALLDLVDALRTLARILAEKSDEVDGAGLLPYLPSGPSLDDLTIGGIPIGNIPVDDWVRALGDLAKPIGTASTAWGIADLYDESYDRYDTGAHRESVTVGLAAARTAVGAGAGIITEHVVCTYGGAAILEAAPQLGAGGPVSMCVVAGPILAGIVADDALAVWDFADEHGDEVAGVVVESHRDALDLASQAWDRGRGLGGDVVARPEDYVWPLLPPIGYPTPVIVELRDAFNEVPVAGGFFD